MSNHHQEGDSKKFMLPIFLSFAIVFCLFVLMSKCKGPYKDHDAHNEDKVEHGSAPGKTHEPTEHKAGTVDTAHGKPAADTAHKTEAHPAEHH
jgi:hypothetical protein